MFRDTFLSKNSSETLDSFLMKNMPSQITIHDASWISIRNEAHQGDKLTGEGEMIEMAFTQGNAILDRLEFDLREGKTREDGRKILKKEMRQEAMSDLQQVALNFGETSGKWMLFIPTSEVDLKWALIAREVLDGRLGFSAKVSTFNPAENFHLVCVYVSNFRDTESVGMVFQRLRELGLASKSFKLDFFTSLGIYSKNKWGLDPCIYSAKSFS
jgi:hypothetical protein